jgi:hypothetical protein
MENYDDLVRAAALTYHQAVKDGFLPMGRPTSTGQRSAIKIASERLGVKFNTIKDRIYDAVSRGIVTAEGELAGKPIKVIKEPEPVIDLLAQRRERDAVTTLKARIKDLEDELLEQRAWRESMESLSRSAIEQEPWTARPHIGRQHSLTPILFTSDFQCGEVISANDLDGINAYNEQIFSQRYQSMIDKTIEISDECTGATDYPGIYYLRGGDAISGEIHDELAETNDLSAVPAIRVLLRHEREGIRRLKDRFGRVRVISIPGNHGRTTHKPRSKKYSERSYETLLAWWLADSFDNDPAVTFTTPPSGDALFDVEGWSFLLSHGDRMGSRGGGGFVGPAATIARGHKRLYDNWSMTGRPVHCILTGHLHTSLKLELGYANGSLAGYNEYARDLRAKPDAAKQWLLFAHQKMMVSNAFELLLSDFPRRTVLEAA